MSGWIYNIVSLNLSLSMLLMDETPEDVADETDNASPFFVSFVGEQIQIFYNC